MTGYEFDTGDGWMSALSLPPPNIPSSHAELSGIAPGCPFGLRTAESEDGESECVRVDPDDGDSVRLEGGMGIWDRAEPEARLGSVTKEVRAVAERGA